MSVWEGVIADDVVINRPVDFKWLHESASKITSLQRRTAEQGPTEVCPNVRRSWAGNHSHAGLNRAGEGRYFVLIGPGPSQPADQLFRRENVKVHLQDSVLRTLSCFGAELSLCDKWSKEVEKLQRR